MAIGSWKTYFSPPSIRLSFLSPYLHYPLFQWDFSNEYHNKFHHPILISHLQPRKTFAICSCSFILHFFIIYIYSFSHHGKMNKHTCWPQSLSLLNANILLMKNSIKNLILWLGNVYSKSRQVFICSALLNFCKRLFGCSIRELNFKIFNGNLGKMLERSFKKLLKSQNSSSQFWTNYY